MARANVVVSDSQASGANRSVTALALTWMIPQLQASTRASGD
jgi:hypothetical protein